VICNRPAGKRLDASSGLLEAGGRYPPSLAAGGEQAGSVAGMGLVGIRARPAVAAVMMAGVPGGGGCTAEWLEDGGPCWIRRRGEPFSSRAPSCSSAIATAG